MQATVTHKKKLIDLKEDTFKSLSVIAARKGTNLKNLIETLLDRIAEEYDDSEVYKMLSERFPEGNMIVSEPERDEFMKWLGVSDKCE